MSGRMRIKICGLSRIEDVGYANAARPDYIGFVFASSKRRVTVDKARVLREKLDAGITPVGVFVDAEIAEIAALVRERVIDAVQLHGDENGGYIKRLRAKCGANIPVIKAIRMEQHQPDKARLRAIYGADYFLLDSSAGSGAAFDERIAGQFAESPAFGSSFFLAGGINRDNMHRAMALRPFAIDVSSGAETDGVKDGAKMAALIAACRLA
jgi:phosphoribosylanthranilate isomerase